MRLGVQPDGSAIVAMTGDLARLPASAECRVSKARGLLFRVPGGSVLDPSNVNVAVIDGVFVHVDGEVDFEGGEIASLPTRWLARLRAANAELANKRVDPRGLLS